MDGLAQETCRDFGHTGMGIAAAMHVAETSRIQGLDLYPRFKDRFRHALGFHAAYEIGAAVPAWLCGGKLTTGIGPATEVGHNALHTRLGVTPENTRRLTEGPPPGGHREPLRGLGDPDPRRQPELRSEALRSVKPRDAAT